MFKNYRFRHVFLFWLLISILASVFLCWCAGKVYGSYNPKQILSLEILIAIAFFLHVRHDTSDLSSKHDISDARARTGGALSKPFSISETLGFENNSPTYDIRYDFIRIFAVFGVILLHCIDLAMPFLSSELNDETLAMIATVPPLLLKVGAVLRTGLFLGNTCFVMLTGALLFGRNGKSKDNVISFYGRRFSKVVLPFIIFFYFYKWQSGYLIPFSYGTVSDCLHRLLTAEIGDCQFLWLIYVTISIYIIVPFFRYMFDSMPYHILTLFSAIIFLSDYLQFYTDITSDLIPVFTGWVGVTIVGYWVSRPETRKYDHIIWICAILSFIMMAAKVNPYAHWQTYVNYYVHSAPLSLFMACGIFALALHKKPKCKHFIHTLVTFFGKHSFSTLLMHWWIIYHIVDYTLDLDVTWERPISFIGVYLFVILASTISGFLIDQTIVYAIRGIGETIIKQIKWAAPELPQK